jgi:hypothetical protein
MELLYIILIVAILVEMIVFMLLNLPTPTGVKGKITRFIENNRRNQIFLFAHMIIFLMAVVLWFDCNRMEEKFRGERVMLNEQLNIGTGIHQLR